MNWEEKIGQSGLIWSVYYSDKKLTRKERKDLKEKYNALATDANKEAGRKVLNLIR